MKYYEYIIAWDIAEGTQVAYAYCNAESKTDAKLNIKQRIPYNLHSIEARDCLGIYPEDKKLGNSVKVWYFTGAQIDSTEKEHTEIY